jgi:hypothetical protein
VLDARSPPYSTIMRAEGNAVMTSYSVSINQATPGMQP